LRRVTGEGIVDAVQAHAAAFAVGVAVVGAVVGAVDGGVLPMR